MTTLPAPTRTFRRSFTTHPRPTTEEDRAYRQACVSQAVDAARMAGGSPVTPPLVTETGTKLEVSFGVVRTSTLTDLQRLATNPIRMAWTLAEPAT